MTYPKPIRFDADTWLVMRSDAVLPKAVIQRVHHAEGDRFMLFKWDTDPAKRMLMSVVDSLERANELVKYDAPSDEKPRLPPSMLPPGHPDRRAEGFKDPPARSAQRPRSGDPRTGRPA